ncbi:MAG: T9SS type A sorting domain-containing protein [Calditrichaeota bacterium]|nr:T9SS type A sorting domain-containing protein [Calditrichota bacterium]
MNRLKFILIESLILYALLFFPGIQSYAQVGSSNSKITTSTMSEAGGEIQSSQYKISQSVGQVGVIGEVSSANFAVMGGYLNQAYAEVQIVAELSLPDTVGGSGETVYVPVFVSTDSAIGIAQFVVEYDSSVIKFVGAQIGGGLSGFSVSQTNENLPFDPTASGANENVLVQISGGGQASFSGDSLEVVLLGFEVVGDTGTSVLAFDSDASHTFLTTVNLSDIRGAALNFFNGSLAVQPGYLVSGTISYFGNESLVPDATVTLDGRTASTSEQGEFSFSNVPGGNYNLFPTKAGELGNAISAYDAAFILQKVVGLINLTPYQMIAADVSGNGSVSAFDASYILRLLVGLIDEFPVAKDWTFVPVSFAINETNWNAAPDSISYAPLNSNQTEQNFYGIVYGDVTGNWSPGGKMLANLPRAASGSATLGWGKIEKPTPGKLTIPLQLQISGDLFAAELKFRYDAAQISFESAESGKSCSDCEMAFNDDHGEISLAMASGKPLSSETELVVLKFKLKDTKNHSGNLLEIERAIFNEGNIKAGALPTLANLDKVLPQKTELFQNYPNPFNPGTEIKYQLDRTCNVRITIFDLLGKEVITLVDKKLDAGTYTAAWNGRDKNGSTVASGVYLYQMKAGWYSNTRKLIYIR